MANRLLNDNALGLLFGRGLWKRERQDAVLHLGLHIFGLTRCQLLSKEKPNCVLTLVPKGSCNVRENLPERRSRTT
jgi:hypothetical protein